MERYRNAFENTGDSQKSSEAMFARKVILVEGESEVLILPYFFSLCGYDEVSEGITIVRCGGKSEIDRYYRLYSEFGIPTFIIFDGDAQNKGKKDERATITKNKAILSLFENDEDFPDGKVHDNYLGFLYRLEENLGISSSGDAKALALFRRVKDEITTREQVPTWVNELIVAVTKLPGEASSVLKTLPDFSILDF